jgi:hypothetical protein
MNKKIRFGLGITALAAFITLNVQVFSTESKRSTINLSKLLIDALAEDEGGGGIPTKCVELGDNYPNKVATSDEQYCAKSGKNETTYTCDLPGDGCTEVKWKD